MPTHNLGGATHRNAPNRIALATLLGIFVPLTLDPQSSRGTTAADSVYLGEPLSNLLDGVASLLQDGFRAEDSKRISQTALQLSPDDLPTSSGRQRPAFEHRVRFQNRPSDLNIGLVAVDIGYVDVRFQSSDTALISAIRGVIWKSYLASLSPIERVRLTVRDEIWIHDRPPTLVLAMETVRQYGCLGFGIDHAFRQRGDTLHLELFGIPSAPRACPAMI